MQASRALILLCIAFGGCHSGGGSRDAVLHPQRKGGVAARPEVPDDDATEDAVRVLEQDYFDSDQTVRDEMKGLTQDEQSKFYRANRPNPLDWAPRFRKFADDNPNTEAGARALAWIVNCAKNSHAAHDALDELLAHYLSSMQLANVCFSTLQHDRGDEVDRILQRIVDDSPAAGVRGSALCVMGRRAVVLQKHGEPGPDPVALFERVVNEYGAVQGGEGETLGVTAQRELFALDDLAIGKIAPDITGEDIYGKALQTSTSRGKVVVLDFWGNW